MRRKEDKIFRRDFVVAYVNWGAVEAWCSVGTRPQGFSEWTRDKTKVKIDHVRLPSWSKSD